MAGSGDVPRALPAWSLDAAGVDGIALESAWPERVSREWALDGATGAGVRVCILDSGVETDHRLVGELEGAVAVSVGADEEITVADDDQGDLCGHGTACAGIVRALAPECSIFSVRVLGAGYTGSGAALLGGLRWAVTQGFDVINMSLSTTKHQFASVLHELADDAYFRRTMLVASAHNMPVESYPWRFSSVISVGSHEEPEALTWFYNPQPPVEFFARGVDVEVAWTGGSTVRCSGNSFATPHMSGISALVLSKHRELTPFQLKSVLFLTATNVGGGGLTREQDVSAAVAAAVLGAEEAHAELLRSIVEVARAIFSARASSIFLLDEAADELVFEAVAGEGSDSLIGVRFPSSTGVAGWVLVTRQPLVIEDVQQDPRFAREAAESTGYVPKGLMAVPLLHGERALGVLEVLDRPQAERFTLAEMDLLGLFAGQAAIALDLLQRARRAREALERQGELDEVTRLVTALEALPESSRDAGLRLVSALEEVLRRK